MENGGHAGVNVVGHRLDLFDFDWRAMASFVFGSKPLSAQAAAGRCRRAARNRVVPGDLSSDSFRSLGRSVWLLDPTTYLTCVDFFFSGGLSPN